MTPPPPPPYSRFIADLIIRQTSARLLLQLASAFWREHGVHLRGSGHDAGHLPAGAECLRVGDDVLRERRRRRVPLPEDTDGRDG